MIDNVKRNSDDLVYSNRWAKMPVMACRFDKNTMLELKRRAKRDGVSVANIIRDLVDKGLK